LRDEVLNRGIPVVDFICGNRNHQGQQRQRTQAPC